MRLLSCIFGEDDKSDFRVFLTCDQAIFFGKKKKSPDRRLGYSSHNHCKRVSMGLTDRRKTAKNLVDSRKN